MDIPFRQYHHEMYLARQRSYHLALFVGLNNCFYKDMSPQEPERSGGDEDLERSTGREFVGVGDGDAPNMGKQLLFCF